MASAKRYLTKNDHQAAVIELKNALQANPKLAEARLLLGVSMLELGDAQGAEVELRRALELGEPAERVYPPLARSLVHQAEYKKVVDQFQGVEGTAARNPELLTALGQALFGLRQREAAEKAFAQALAVQPGYVPAILGNARLKAATRDLAGALALTQTALDSSPKSLAAQELRAALLAASGQLDQAIAGYRKTLELRPKYLPAHAALVSLLIQQQKLDDAGPHVSKLAELAPKHPETLYWRAMYEYRRNNLPASRDAIMQHLNAAPNSLRGLLLASAIEHDSKSYHQAEAHLQQVLARAPRLAPAQRLLVMNHLRSGQVTNAVDALKPLLASGGDDPVTFALAGEAHLAGGNPSRAAFYFAKASELDPKDDRKLTGLALSHLAEGKTDEAVRELEQAVVLDSTGRADVALIVASLRKRDFNKAFAAIDALEKKQPGKPLPHHLRGAALAAKRDVASAKKSFEQAVSLDPSYFPSIAQLALLDVAEGKPEEAKKRLEALLKRNPKSAPALLALAGLESRANGRTEEAAALIRRAIAISPTDVAARVAIINHYLQAKDPKKAAAAAQEALDAIPSRPEILDAAGRAQYAAGAVNEANTTFAKWSRLQPESPQPWLRLAQLQLANKDLDGAARNYGKALQLKPDLVDAQVGLIAVDLRRDRGPQALATAQTMQKQRPKESVGYLMEGDIHARKPAWPQAIAVYRAGLKQVDTSDLAIRLHAAYRASGQAAEADRFEAARLKQRPDDAGFRLHLAQAAVGANQFDRASEHYRALVALQPNNAILLNNLAWAAGRANDPQAISYAEKAYSMRPNDPAVMDTLGVLLVEKGDTARGLDLLRKASAAAPDRPALRFNLAKSLLKAGDKTAARNELEQLAKLGTGFAGHEEVQRLLKGS